MSDLPLSARIEAVLFARSEPISRDELANLLKTNREGIDTGLRELESVLKGRGISLIDDGREVELRTSPEAAELIETMRKDELSRDIGKAGLETLSILLYKGPATRSEVDYIRGVNSSHILRVLASRGLVRRKDNPNDERSYVYEATTELLSELGVGKREDLPEFAAIADEIRRITEMKDEGHANA